MPSRLFMSSGDMLADRRFEFARDLQLSGDLVAAEDLFVQTTELAPGFATAWFTLGEVRELLGDRAGAIVAFRAAEITDPGDRNGAGLRLMRLGAADVTGIILASVMAAIGFFILPARRNRAKEEMREKIAAVRARLSAALREQFQREIQKSVERIREGIAPYSRFIRAEGEQLKAVDQELREIGNELAGLRARIERIAA